MQLFCLLCGVIGYRLLNGLLMFTWNMVIGMGSGVIPIPSISSCSSQLRYTTDFNDHKDCRRKQRKIDRKLEETQISLQQTQISLRGTRMSLREARMSLQETRMSLRETQSLLRHMQKCTANMEEGMLKMQEKIDMLMALVRRLENFSNIIYFFTHKIVIMGMIIV
jgi:septal ring factor EnvC (AmiA/AmiB activator)